MKRESSVQRALPLNAELVAPPTDLRGDSVNSPNDSNYNTAASKFPTWSQEEISHFTHMNEQFVDDVHLSVFYKPHSITLILLTMGMVVVLALNEPPELDHYHRIMRGMLATFLVFLTFSVVALPNGPFVRPHPAVWRCVLGMSILYWLLMVFALFQTRETVRDAIVWLSNVANIPYQSPEDSPEYAANCELTFDNLVSRIDIFCVAHALGWVGKAVMLRSVWLSWLISISWELTEVIFSGVLPNFSECWWDQLIFDILVCNALGIAIGSSICKYLECRTYNWESLSDVSTLRGKVKRAALQFTPQDWTRVEWEPFSSRRRTLSVILICFSVVLMELNTFFLKHILKLPTKHSFNVYRLLIWFTFGMPALRQLYIYTTDKRVKRLGTQSWVALAVLLTESLICVKFGRTFFEAAAFMRALLTWAAVMGACIAVGLGIAEVCHQRR